MLKALRPQNYSKENTLRQVGTAPADALGATLRVLVWNILKARRRDFHADFSRLCADRDLVLLQEAVLNAPSDALFADQQLEWIMARSFRDVRSGVEHGVKTGCTATAVSREVFRSTHCEPVVQTHKLLLATRYRLQNSSPGKPDSACMLLVLNIHAINFVRLSQYREQLSQVERALTGHTGPVILAGDFNTWSTRRRESFFALADGTSLVEARLQRRGRLGHLAMNLDHVFYRELHLRDAVSLGHVRSSDHPPIMATFDIEKPDGEMAAISA